MAEMIEISRLPRDVLPAIPRRVALRGIRGSNVGMLRLPRLMTTTRNLLHRREYPLARAPSGYLAASHAWIVRGILLYQTNVPCITRRPF